MIEKREVYHDKIASETNAYNCRETAAEEFFRINVILTTLDLIVNDLANRLEAHKNICDLFCPILNYLSLSCNRFEEK
jgi:hypothetical protein